MSNFLFGFLTGVVATILLCLLAVNVKPVKTALWNSGHYPEFLVKKWPDNADATTLCSGQTSVTSWSEHGVFLRCEDGTTYRRWGY